MSYFSRKNMRNIIFTNLGIFDVYELNISRLYDLVSCHLINLLGNVACREKRAILVDNMEIENVNLIMDRNACG